MGDLREGTRHAVRSILGPHVCADSVDISSDGAHVLTGSWAKTDQLRIWNFGDGQLVDAFQWTSGGPKPQICKVYAAQFSKHDRGSMVLAGGSGVEDAKVFNWKNGWKEIGNVVCQNGECQTVDFSNTGDKLALG